MKLKSFQVTDFRSIRDSGVIDVNDITCFVGKNESGKTALMQALYRLNPINEENMEFNSTEDYPRVEVDDYEYDVENGNRKPARVIKVWFELENDDLEKLVEDYSEKVIGNKTIELSRGYDNILYSSVDISEVNLTEHLIKKLLHEELADEAKQHKAVDDLVAYCEEAITDEDKAESITPLQTELNKIQNADGANEFFFTSYIKPLIPKFLYFDEKVMSDVLARKGKTALSEKWTITPSGGVGKIPMFVSLIGSQRKTNIATLMDIDSKTDQIAQQLLKQKLLKKKNLITCSQYNNAESADLEDLFDRNFYVDLVNQEFNMDIDYNAVNPSIHRVLVALKPQFTNVQFNHYRPARLLSERLSDFEPKISNEAIGRFDKLFSDLNALLRK